MFHRLVFEEAGPREAGKVLEALEPNISFFIDRHGDARMTMDVSMRLMPDAYVSRQRLANVATSRDRKHIERDNNNNLTLLVNLGGAPIHLGLPERRHGRDEAMAGFDTPAFLKGNEERYTAFSDGCDSLVVSIPRAGVAEVVSDLDRGIAHGVPMTPALRLLVGYARTLATDVGIASPELAAVASSHLRDLFILALGATRDGAEMAGGGARAARLARIKADIHANLGNPELSLDWLARRHGMRPRGIQNLFYAAGEGFVEYMRNARLERARETLGDPAHAWRNVAEIAFSCGFGDISWFNNAFRRRFGMTPSEVRASGPRGEIR